MTSSILERIVTLFMNNNYSEVVVLFTENIDKISNQKDKMRTYHFAAKSYYHLGKNKEAFDCIQKVINSVDFWKNLIIVKKQNFIIMKIN